MIRRLVQTIREELAALLIEPTMIICGASALLVISHYNGSTMYFHEVFGALAAGHPAMAVLAHEYWFGMSVVLYLVAPLLLSKATNGSFHQKYGLGLGDWRQGLSIAALFLAIMLPIVWYASTTESFKGHYPLAGSSAYNLSVPEGFRASLPLFVVYELGYLAYFIAWEFLFRGWMVHGLLPWFGRTGAILVQVAPFVIMHFGKAEPETLGAVIAGVALGVLSVRTRSMWYGALIHGVVAVWMDCWSVPGSLFGLGA